MDDASQAQLQRARAGDANAFRALTDPHRGELLAHCYRMLGSLQDAEDALQEVMLAAWNGFDGYEGRSSVRTWLYRIATNRCLNVLRTASRRPATASEIPGRTPPEPSRLGEVPWLEPIPDRVMAELAPATPEARYEQREAMSLAFITAIQTLPPRQVAVVILRDVMGYPAAEVADMLDTTVDSVTSALARARGRLRHLDRAPDAAPQPTSDAQRRLVESFVRAYEAADVDGVVSLLTDDVFVTMPPLPLEYVGRAAAGAFFAAMFRDRSPVTLVPTAANGHPAFGSYARRPDGTWTAAGLLVVVPADNGVRGITRFESHVLPGFGLPAQI